MPPTTDADNNLDLHGGQATAVLRQWNHPSYNATTVDNDVAVLTLAAICNGDSGGVNLVRSAGLNRDGFQDWIYPGKGTGKATSEIFGTTKSLGTGFRQYDLFG